MDEVNAKIEDVQAEQVGETDKDADGLLPGVITAMGSLPSATLLTEDGLAGIMGKACRESIKRAVARGELPPPVKIMGKNAWTVGSVVRHIEARLESAARDQKRLTQMRP